MKRLEATVAFGEFELDPRRHELRRGGHRVALQEQPYQILECLLERPDELVTREELRDRLWPAGVYVEHEKSINVAVMKLREALGDSAEEPRFIVTLPRLGYRFIAPVSARPAALDSEHARLDELRTTATTLASQEWGGQATREHSTALSAQQPKAASRGLWIILRSVGGSFRGWLRAMGGERR
jgi:DNA-binding winged helix-turn-helix (wHTH) protein